MANDNSTETLRDFSQRQNDAYQAAIDVDTMLNALRDAISDSNVAHMYELIIERNGTVSEFVETVGRELKETDRAP